MTETTKTAPTKPRSSRTRLTVIDLLWWLYLGRLMVVAGIFVAAIAVWGSAEPRETFLATAMFVLALFVTATAAWHSHVQKAKPSTRGLVLVAGAGSQVDWTGSSRSTGCWGAGVRETGHRWGGVPQSRTRRDPGFFVLDRERA